MNQPDSFETFIIQELLQSKAAWLGLVCASLIPDSISRMDVNGNLDQCRQFLKSKNAMVKEFQNRSEVWAKGVKIAEFIPFIDPASKKLDIIAKIAGFRVQLPPTESSPAASQSAP